MPDRLKKLERELGLPPSPPPFALDETQICRRVEGALSARGEDRKRYMRHKTRLAAVLAAAVVVLAGTAIVLFDWMRHWLFQEERPHYRWI